MVNTLKVNYTNHTIVMDRTFAKRAMDTWTEEYAHLQAVRKDYPNYEVVQRHIRTNSNKNTYAGLTYEYMESYIITHGTEETRLANFKTLQEMRVISECQGKAFRYPVIKSWFLEMYPEIANFGVKDDDEKKNDSEGETRGQSLEVLKNQGSEGDNQMTSTPTDDSTVTKAV